MNKEPLVITDAAKRSIDIKCDLSQSEKYMEEKLARAAIAEQKMLDKDYIIIDVFMNAYEIMRKICRGVKTK